MGGSGHIVRWQTSQCGSGKERRTVGEVAKRGGSDQRLVTAGSGIPD